MRIFGVSHDIPFQQQFLASGVKANGLTVTADVYRDGVSLLATQATTEIATATGIYKYTLPLASTGVEGIYTVVFVTTGTADQKRIQQEAQVAAWIDVIATINTNALAAKNAAVSSLAVVEQYPGVNIADLPNFQRVGSQVTVALSGSVYTPVLPKRANGVFVQVTVHDAYFTLDGTTPSSTVGFQMTNGQVWLFIPIVQGSTVLKFLRSASGSVLNLQYVNRQG